MPIQIDIRNPDVKIRMGQFRIVKAKIEIYSYFFFGVAIDSHIKIYAA